MNTRTPYLFIGGEMDGLGTYVPDGRDDVRIPMEDDYGSELYLRHTITGENKVASGFFAISPLTTHEALQLLIKHYKPKP